MKSETIEIARQKLVADSRNVQLTLTEDGSIEITTCDTGDAPNKIFGRDYEFWVKISAEHLPRLAFILLKEKYSGNVNATDHATKLCREHGIECEWDSYP